ncbi:MAG: Gfo/Idh/MocA family oxidoreductase [Polyangiaceae bacterium]
MRQGLHVTAYNRQVATKLRQMGTRGGRNPSPGSLGEGTAQRSIAVAFAAMAKVFRLGLVGTGVAARELYAPAFAELAGRVNVVACANRTRAKAERFAKEQGIPIVLDDFASMLAHPEIDGILISLPIDQQPRLVLEALRAGIPVLSEKPVAPSVSVGKSLVRKAARYRTPWLVGENFAFLSHVETLDRWLREGRFGEVRLVQVTHINLMNARNPYFHTPWRARPGHVGGFVVDGGVHLANVVRRCFGMPSVLRSAIASFDSKLPPMDTALGLLKFPSGALGTWTSCFSASYDGPILRVFGSRANAELTWDSVTIRDAKGKTSTRVNRRNSFVSELLHFKDMVFRGAPPRVTAADALEDLVLVERLCAGR